ncbi:Protein of unknown function [Chitinophaga ginsengisegetis]|uniref:DUF1572 domain-containing protein n=1 Tax=Chitinophaga ginsengisegetis TaxID=393003 RepID=A0A1T5NEA6_9BACT|nr:DUF1572 family protein [Chitinophaga ginsengisegetis]SKC98850.1 Protein of unknown function [Chitinophaga ginsengisegetis]
MSIQSIYLQSVLKRLEIHRELGLKTIQRLNKDQLNWQPDGEPNSIAMIVKHLHGNMLSRWTDFLTTDGEKPGRNRDLEFEESALTQEQLLQRWDEGWDCMLLAIRSLQETDLDRTVFIRNEPHIVIDAINRQLAHVPYHVGQIVYIGKMILKDKWESLSIPKGGSAAHNKEKTGN